MISFKIVGNGTYQPRNLVLSRDLDEKLNKNSGWTEKNFKIVKRGIAQRDETSSVMGAKASLAALYKAKWKIDDIDVIIGACGVMEQPIPSTSVLIQRELGLGKSGIPTFDVNLTCLSFMSALDIASMGISCGNWKKILIVSSDIASAGLDYSIAETASIFGDGAAAICIEATTDNHSGLISREFETYGDYHELATLRSGGTKIRVEDGFEEIVKGSRFYMDSFGIFKAAARCLPALIDRVLEQGGQSRKTIDRIICHQASAPAIKHVRHLFKSDPDRVVNIFPNFGNQIASSIPTVLSYAIDTNLVRPGNHVLLLGTAAGISAGAMLLKI